ESPCSQPCMRVRDDSCVLVPMLTPKLNVALAARQVPGLHLQIIHRNCLLRCPELLKGTAQVFHLHCSLSPGTLLAAGLTLSEPQKGFSSQRLSAKGQKPNVQNSTFSLI
ncbi:unnamed protein product, partial [Rangifer tarandus platyrhynchus]